VVTAQKTPRRSLKYIRLAAYLAGQPTDVRRLVMSLDEVEEVVGETLPPNSRFPSWWRNDARKMHARAWLAAGWEAERMNTGDHTIEFVRADGK
jgi:hypothetical protein